jgi:hypothetical protein
MSKSLTNTLPRWFWESQVGKKVEERFDKLTPTTDYKVARSKTIHTHKAVGRKFGGHCSFCGDLFVPESLTIDHLVPKARGGGKGWSNLYPACAPCNSAKADSSVSQFRLAIAERCGRFQNGKQRARLVEVFGPGPVVFWFETHREEC